MEKTLQLTFRNEEGRLFNLQLASPREDLTEADIAAVMDELIAKDIFQSSGGSLTEKVRARLVSREIEDIADFA